MHMTIYQDDQPLDAVRWPVMPEDVAATIIPKMAAEIERLDAVYINGEGASAEQRRLAAIQKQRLNRAIDRFELAIALLDEHPIASND